MIKTLQNIFKVSASQTVNQFIYYFKRIPLIGKILPDSIYQDGSLKIVLSAMIYIFVTCFIFFKKALYLGLSIVLPMAILHDTIPKAQQLNAGIQIFVVLSFVIGALHNPSPLKKSMDKYSCVKLLGMRAKEYSTAIMVYENIIFFIGFLPSIIILSVIAKWAVYKGIALLIMLICARALGLALHMALFVKIKKVIIEKWWFYTVVYSLVGLAYAPLLLGYIANWSSWFVSLPAFLIAIAFGAMSVWYLFTYRYYPDAVKLSIMGKDFAVNTKQIQKEAAFASVKLKDSDLEIKKESLASINRKKGYEYLNALFFQRHRRLLVKPIYIRLICIMVAFVGACVGLFFLPDERATLVNQIASSLNIFVFIMYCASTGDKTAKALFYNCDISLLRYGFYRERTVILKNFWIRLKKCIWYNLIPAIAICVALQLLFMAWGNGIDYSMMVPFYFSILFLSVFFSVHHLFLYYVFQPYTTELDVKNPFFKLINGVVYVACYICLQIDSVPTFFVWGVLIATVLYIMVALFLVNKYAPKMFRVK
ncbi:hypothetical protein RBG61_07040 [Paludicola sp. MB14-C6]|uniref:hypothetical protein n=1 Tax=Paludihabitans sp. MB14-C6 TaxID=3070656 RepID=UPI0027DE6EF4|nr:hypothetical protein [Paludicola sp. MB14-C6]WMJ24414.1 hypothetical protein RBG61_07040 [Paludicola sp. MB14-C6]